MGSSHHAENRTFRKNRIVALLLSGVEHLHSAPEFFHCFFLHQFLQKPPLLVWPQTLKHAHGRFESFFDDMILLLGSVLLISGIIHLPRLLPKSAYHEPVPPTSAKTGHFRVSFRCFSCTFPPLLPQRPQNPGKRGENRSWSWDHLNVFRLDL